MTRACVDCGKPVTGHNDAVRCLPCGARHGYIKKHGAPPLRAVGLCAACGKKYDDYASNRTQGVGPERFCSKECRAAWTGVKLSIARGGDGVRRSKPEKDALDYIKHADNRRQKSKDRYERDREKILLGKQRADRALKQETIAAYGGRCACCGETLLEFLTIDHKDGSGAEHRRRTGKGRKIYADLKAQGFPQGPYQVLCLNCNIALGFYGYCPHNPNVRRVVNKRQRGPAGRPREVA